MKKIISILTVVIVLLNIIRVNDVEAISFSPSVKLYSEAAILYNIDTKTVVYEKNADMQKVPAQLVQIMTAIITLENTTNIEEVRECPEQIFAEFDQYSETYPEETFPYNEVTTCYISPGEQLSVKNFLYAMLLRSSCEAASTLAYTVGDGNIQNFVNKMNEKAAEIGAVNTHFTNPHGLYQEGQYSTARDMLLITNYALSVPGFSDIVSQATYLIPPSNMSEEGIRLENVNVMMDKESEYFFPGTKGIKTGNSEQSGRCIISQASQNGSNYIAVLMKAPFEAAGEPEYTHILDATALFEWAFENLEHRVVLQASREIQTVKINYAKGKDEINLKPANDIMCMWQTTLDTSLIDVEDVEYVYEELNAPIKAGQKLGVLTLRYSGKEIEKVDLVAYGDVDRSIIKYSMAIIESYFSSDSFSKALKVATGLSVMYIIIVIYVAYRRAKKRRERRIAQNRNSGRSLK